MSGTGGEDQATFAAQLERIEQILRRLETEDIDLDEALRLFEEGVERLRAARERLAAAEARVKRVVTGPGGGGTLRVEDANG